MVDYDSLEQSVSDGNPIELFEFIMGSTAWRYTSGNVSVSHETQTWVPAMIGRGSIEQGQESLKTEVEVEFHRSESFADIFIAYPPEQEITFRLLRGHDGYWETYWVGVVGSFRYTIDKVTVVIMPPHRGGSVSSLRRKYQIPCPWPLYSRQCSISKTPWMVTGVVDTISGKVITSTTFAGKADGWFKGGYIVVGNSERMITSHITNTINTVLPMPAVAVGDTFLAYAGCGHDVDACNDKFANKINYGGQPWLPEKNPFGNDGTSSA